MSLLIRVQEAANARSLRAGHRRPGTPVLLLALLVLNAAQASVHESGGFSYEFGSTPAFVRLTEVAPVEPVQAPAVHPVLTWLNETQQDFRDGGAYLYRHTVDQALTGEGVRQLAQPSINFDPSYQTLRLHQVAVERDGELQDRFDPAAVTLAQRELDADAKGMHTGIVTAMLVLDDVRIGDRVHLAWSLQGRHPVLGALGGEDYFLAWPWPMRHRLIRLLVDEDGPAHVRVPPGHPQPRVHGGEIVMELRDLPALEIESLLPPGHFPIPLLEYSPVDRWAAVANWASELFPPSELPAELRELAARIAGEHPDDPQAQALAALRFVQDELRYLSLSLGESTHRPAEPTTVLRRRFGDCKDKSRLLVELLKLLDIEAAPALVHSSLGAGLPQRLPRANAFDHVIVQLRIGDSVHWVDPTATLQGGDLRTQGFPDFDHALVIAPDSVDLTAMQRPAESLNLIALDEHFQATLAETELRTVQTWEGAYAEWLRQRLAADGKRAVRDELRGRYSLIYGAITPLGELQVDDDRRSNRVTLTDRIQLQRFLLDGTEPGSVSFSVHADFVEQMLPIPTEVARQNAIAIPFPLRVRQQVRVDLPDGLLPDHEVDSTLVEDPYLRFERTASRKLDHFEASFDTLTLADQTGNEDLDRHIDHRRSVHQALGMSVRLQRAGERSESREARMRRLLQRDQ